jgi:CxxC-x17-CxxC domain-containing protein
VKVQKRQSVAPVTTREKICATCGRPFRLAPDEKFFNCPECHRKANPPRRDKRSPKDAQILTQITCVACGTQAYVDFVPTDPSTALCETCFSARRRELQPPKTHKERR